MGTKKVENHKKKLKTSIIDFNFGKTDNHFADF